MRVLAPFITLLLFTIGCELIVGDTSEESNDVPDPFTEFIEFRYSPNDTLAALEDLEIRIVLEDSVNEHTYRWQLPESVSSRVFTTREPSFLFNVGTVTGSFEGSVEVIPIIDVGDKDPVVARFNIVVIPPPVQ